MVQACHSWNPVLFRYIFNTNIWLDWIEIAAVQVKNIINETLDIRKLDYKSKAEKNLMNDKNLDIC